MARLLRGASAGVWFATLAPACTALALGVVLHQWTTGHEGRTAIVFGIYPYSDAGQFYSDTQRLLAGLPFEVASRRPLHAAVTTAMLRAAFDDLRFVLAAQAAAMGAATAFAASEARRAAGERAALVVLLVGCFFQRRFAGFVATEALGWPLGALAFGLILRARDARGRDATVAIFAGMLSLSLALLARAGPMLVAPAICVWAFASAPRDERLARLAAAAGGVTLAIALNAMLAREVSGGATFVDLPPILYGALHHDDFTRIFADHPELAALAPAERYDAMMRIVRHDAWAHPSLALSAAAYSLSSFFGAPEGLFSFVFNTPDDRVFERNASPGVAGVLAGARELGPYGVANVVVMGALAIAFIVAFVVGLVRAWRTRSWLFVSIAAGALASIPFTPPWITASVQVETAIVPFFALVAALAFRGGAREPAHSPRRPAIVLAGFVLTATLGIAFVVARPDRAPPSRACAEGAANAATTTVRADPSTRLLVGRRPASMATLAANAFFLRRHDASLVEALEHEVRPGRAMVLVYDSCAGEARLAIGDDADVPRDREWRALAYTPTADPFVIAVSRAW